MGQAFTDSWQISTRLNISLVQLGYTRLVYPGHSIDRIQIGSGIVLKSERQVGIRYTNITVEDV